MKALAAHHVVPLWERGQGKSLPARALSTLVAACAELDEAEAAALPIGALEARLLDLWDLTFGPQIDGYVECPACGEPLEVPLRTDTLRCGEGPATGAQTLEQGAWTVRFRSLTWADLVAAAHAENSAAGRAILMERCVIAASRGEDDRPVGTLPEAVAGALAKRLEAADAAAEIRVGLACPACTHRWSAVFEIADFLWSELGAQARRSLLEVHTLASAYGWREKDILALSPARRRFYLDEVWG